MVCLLTTSMLHSVRFAPTLSQSAKRASSVQKAGAEVAETAAQQKLGSVQKAGAEVAETAMQKKLRSVRRTGTELAEAAARRSRQFVADARNYLKKVIDKLDIDKAAALQKAKRNLDVEYRELRTRLTREKLTDIPAVEKALRELYENQQKIYTDYFEQQRLRRMLNLLDTYPALKKVINDDPMRQRLAAIEGTQAIAAENISVLKNKIATAELEAHMVSKFAGHKRELYSKIETSQNSVKKILDEIVDIDNQIVNTLKKVQPLDNDINKLLGQRSQVIKNIKKLPRLSKDRSNLIDYAKELTNQVEKLQKDKAYYDLKNRIYLLQVQKASAQNVNLRQAQRELDYLKKQFNALSKREQDIFKKVYEQMQKRPRQAGSLDETPTIQSKSITLNELVDAMNQVQKATADLEKYNLEVKKLSTDISTLNDRQKKIDRTITDLNNKKRPIEHLQEALREINDQRTPLEIEMRAIKIQRPPLLEAVRKADIALSIANDAFAQEREKVAQSVKTLESDLNELQQIVGTTERTYQDQVQKTLTPVKRYNTELERITTMLAELEKKRLQLIKLMNQQKGSVSQAQLRALEQEIREHQQLVDRLQSQIRSQHDRLQESKKAYEQQYATLNTLKKPFVLQPKSLPRAKEMQAPARESIMQRRMQQPREAELPAQESQRQQEDRGGVLELSELKTKIAQWEKDINSLDQAAQGQSEDQRRHQEQLMNLVKEARTYEEELRQLRGVGSSRIQSPERAIIEAPGTAQAQQISRASDREIKKSDQDSRVNYARQSYETERGKMLYMRSKPRPIISEQERSQMMHMPRSPASFGSIERPEVELRTMQQQEQKTGSELDRQITQRTKELASIKDESQRAQAQEELAHIEDERESSALEQEDITEEQKEELSKGVSIVAPPASKPLPLPEV